MKFSHMSKGSLAKNVWEPLHTLPEPCRATPTKAASYVTVKRATSEAQIPSFPPKLPSSTQNKEWGEGGGVGEGGLLQKFHVGVRLLEAEVSTRWELPSSSEPTELKLTLG